MKELFALTLNGTPIEAPPNIPSGEGFSITNLATAGVSVAMVIGILLSLVYLVYGGMFWIQSRGDKTKLDKARRIILFAVIGVVVMALSLVAVNALTAALGVGSIYNGAAPVTP